MILPRLSAELRVNRLAHVAHAESRTRGTAEVVSAGELSDQ
jgi:hypothetical protein